MGAVVDEAVGEEPTFRRPPPHADGLRPGGAILHPAES